MNEGVQLNSEQQKAVAAQEGPVLIVAGAGAGKTNTIVERIRALLARGVPAERILAVTFTNKAAGEMRERLQLHTQGALPMVATFHALAVHIIRHEHHSFGVAKHFSILDRDDSIATMKRAFQEIGADPKRFDPRSVLNTIGRAKGDLITREAFAEEHRRSPLTELTARAWGSYAALLKKAGAFDFDDLVTEVVYALRRDVALRARWQARWHYLHIDEYQDTNTAQYEFSKLLAAQHKNICVVGDVDQSIYGWRGADFRNIVRFERDYPEAQVFVLEENYRSTQTILAAANQVIEKNTERKKKTLFTKNKVGEKITLTALGSELEEARAVAARAHSLITHGLSPARIAVLYRANFQSRVLEEAFLAEGVPYRVLGIRFYERAEVKDVLSYLRVALNPNDTESFVRIANVPRRGLGKVALAKIVSGQVSELPRAQAAAHRNLQILLERIGEESTRRVPSELIKFIVQESGLEKEYREGGDEGLERLENIQELVSIAQSYDPLPPEDGLTEFLTDAALVNEEEASEEEGANEAVRLMTVHAAKGLEFHTVFITGLEHNLFPHARSDSNRDSLEEERRLFYVALTRAEEKLYLSYAHTRTLYGSRVVNIPSPFLFDVSDDLLEQGSADESEQVIEWD